MKRILISKNMSCLHSTETQKKPHFRGFRGVPAGIRTRGLPLRRRTLYPAELRKLAIRLFAERRLLHHYLRRRPLYPAELRELGMHFLLLASTALSTRADCVRLSTGGEWTADRGKRIARSRPDPNEIIVRTEPVCQAIPGKPTRALFVMHATAPDRWMTTGRKRPATWAT